MAPSGNRRWRTLALVLLIALAIAGRFTGCGATAKCRDGSYSWSSHHRGTCASHGGVQQWLR